MRAKAARTNTATAKSAASVKPAAAKSIPPKSTSAKSASAKSTSAKPASAKPAIPKPTSVGAAAVKTVRAAIAAKPAPEPVAAPEPTPIVRSATQPDAQPLSLPAKPAVTIARPAPKPEVVRAKPAPRADIPPTDGFTLLVDGHFKSQFDDLAGAKAAACDLLGRFPMLRVEIYDATAKTRLPV